MWHNARRFIMPCVLALSACIILHSWWLGLLMLPTMGTLTLAYDNFGKGNFSRAIWSGLQASIIGLGLFLTGHLILPFYLSYILVNMILSGILNNRVDEIIGDLIFGAWLGSIVLLVR